MAEKKEKYFKPKSFRLSEEVIQELLKLKGRGKSWDRFFRKLLKQKYGTNEL